MKVQINGNYYDVASCSPTLDGKLSVSFTDLTIPEVFSVVNGVETVEFYAREDDEATSYNVGDIMSVYTGRYGVTATLKLR